MFLSVNEKNGIKSPFLEKRETNGKGDEKIKSKKVLMVGLVFMMIVVMTVAVEAKTYKPFAGHPAVQYYQSDMGYPLKKCIERVEYDTDYNAKKPGVRLYLTSYGKDQINSPGGSYYLEKVTSYVTSRPEWRSDRSYTSVATEIAAHCEAAKIDPSKVSPTHVEYFYKDLKFWERPVYGR